MFASTASALTSPHRCLAFWSSTAQRTNGGIIVRAPGFPPGATTSFGVVTLWAHHLYFVYTNVDSENYNNVH